MNDLITHPARKTKGRPRLFAIALPLVAVAILLATGAPAQAQHGGRGPHVQSRHDSRDVHRGHNDRGSRYRSAPVVVQRNHRDDYRRHDAHVRGGISYHNNGLSIRVGIGGHGHHRGHYVPGHYVTRIERVLVRPGHVERVFVPAVYETRYDRRGRPYEILVCEATYRTVHHPPVYHNRTVKVWVPGHYERH